MFLEHLIVTFGCPLEIFTDQGRQFESKLFKSLCETLEIVKKRTAPYHPSSNGQVERYNRTIVQMIRCFIENKDRQWDKYLPLLAMALRATIHKQTGFTPNRLMLGREVIRPLNIMTGAHDQILKTAEPSCWVQELEKHLSEAHEICRTNLKSAQLRQKKNYDLRVLENSYQIGDVVLLFNSATKVGQSSKLKSPWKGPYLVVDSKPPLYTIQNKKRKANCTP